MPSPLSSPFPPPTSSYPPTPSTSLGVSSAPPSEHDLDLQLLQDFDFDPSFLGYLGTDDSSLSLSDTPTWRSSPIPRTSPQKRPRSPETPDSPVQPAPPLPALWAEFDSTPGASSQSLEQSGPVPQGTKGWPLRYASDMLLGFREVQRLTDEVKGARISDVFHRVFKQSYKRATYYENLAFYKRAASQAGIDEINSWIAKGRVEGAEWTAFKRAWPKAGGEK